MPTSDRVSRYRPYAAAVLTLAVVVGAGWWLWTSRDTVVRAVDVVRGAGWLWIVACAAAAAVSMIAAAAVQRHLLVAAGVVTPRRWNVGLVFASNAWSVTLPAGGIIGTATTFRFTRMWGASRAVASWQVFVAGIFSSAALVVLCVVGLIVLGPDRGVTAVLVSVAVLFALVAPLVIVARRTAGVRTLAAGGAVRVARWLRRDEASASETAGAFVDRLAEVRVPMRTGGAALGWSMANWAFDFACFVFAVVAVTRAPDLGVLAVAFLAAKVIASAQITPSGVGPVETVLTSTLIGAGVAPAAALAGVAVYRAVATFGVGIVGWVIYVGWFRGAWRSTDAPAVPARVAAAHPEPAPVAVWAHAAHSGPCAERVRLGGGSNRGGAPGSIVMDHSL
ncbi:UPF0104 family protein [Rhodococcus rhodnii]|uniref:UPF0104 family protein n=1 Tax=Rhodococcus rhodnii TaxID=38312 RepID=A0A6P2CBI8_9NOCA|nr:lysylphosphatidylglycerol synthase transmembrane domain-containing protein [Rhodococcus rhodnii]TXG89895.1 UPF0104 family protein [Rhodococcus rhodnii]